MKFSQRFLRPCSIVYLFIGNRMRLKPIIRLSTKGCESLDQVKYVDSFFCCCEKGVRRINALIDYSICMNKMSLFFMFQVQCLQGDEEFKDKPGASQVSSHVSQRHEPLNNESFNVLTSSPPSLRLLPEPSMSITKKKVVFF